MTQKDLYLIGDLPGFTPQIGRLVSMLNDTRSTTLQAVAGLTVEELDYLHDSNSNSIGTLESMERTQRAMIVAIGFGVISCGGSKGTPTTPSTPRRLALRPSA